MKLEDRIDAVVKRLRGKGVEIQPLSNAPWIVEVENQIGCQLPETYRNLVQRYSFPTIELGPLILFSNFGDMSDDDLTSAPFKDPVLARWIIQSGYIHFARTSSGNYDPICIDVTSAKYPKQTTPVLKFDHEAILLENATVSRQVIAQSFLGLLEEYV